MATAIRPGWRQRRVCISTWIPQPQPIPRKRERNDLLRAPYNLILSIDQDCGRVNRRIGQLEAHDDDLFALLDKVRSGPIDTDHAGARLPRDDVGFEPCTGGVAHHQYLLAR